jgi:ribosomal protein L19
MSEMAAMNKIIEQIESARMLRKVPDFSPGDTVLVQVKVVEGDRERVQAYEGIVIAKRNRGFNSRSRCARCRSARASSALSRPTARP